MINKRKSLIVFAVLIAILPFLGIPFLYRSTLIALLGVAVGLVAYFLDAPIQRVPELDTDEDDELSHEEV